MRSQTGLVRRKGSRHYYFRARVPGELIESFGKSVIFESLGTSDRSQAIGLAAAKRHELEQERARLRQARKVPSAPLPRMFLSDDEIRAICERYIAGALAEDDKLRLEGMSEKSSKLHADILESHYTTVSSACARGDVSDTNSVLQRHLKEHVGLQIEEGSPSYRKLALEFLRAEVEATRLMLARQRGERVRAPALPMARTSFDELIRVWAAHASPTATTRKAFKATFDELLLAHPGLSVESASKEHLRRWKDALQQDGQAPGTIEKKLSYLRAAFNVAVDNELITVNPTRGLKAPRQKGQKSRLPFTVDELTSLFSCDIFVSGHRPKGGGGDAAYWLPLIGLYSGARLEEIAQLRPADVLEHPGLGWYLNITDEGDGSVKTANARRRVPVHPQLVRIGLIAYIEDIRKKRLPFLFPDLVVDVKDVRSGNWSKWFGRFKKGIVGLSDRRKVFHSFRHCFVDACRDSGVLPEVRDALVGHANSSTAALYGEGSYPIGPLVEAIGKIRYPGLDLSHIAWSRSK
jgi:integrase